MQDHRYSPTGESFCDPVFFCNLWETGWGSWHNMLPFDFYNTSIADSSVIPGICILTLLYCIHHGTCGYVQYSMILKTAGKSNLNAKKPPFSGRQKDMCILVTVKTSCSSPEDFLKIVFIYISDLIFTTDCASVLPFIF